MTESIQHGWGRSVGLAGAILGMILVAGSANAAEGPGSDATSTAAVDTQRDLRKTTTATWLGGVGGALGGLVVGTYGTYGLLHSGMGGHPYSYVAYGGGTFGMLGGLTGAALGYGLSGGERPWRAAGIGAAVMGGSVVLLAAAGEGALFIAPVVLFLPAVTVAVVATRSRRVELQLVPTVQSGAQGLALAGRF